VAHDFSDRIPAGLGLPALGPRPLRLLVAAGGAALDRLARLGRFGTFLVQTGAATLTPPYRPHQVVEQIHFIGVRSLFVILFTGLFTGMVLALQGAYTLRKFGSEGLLGSAVALSLLRELGPTLTALMVIGRAGSAICAELAIMRNAEQIDALECMAIDPFRYLLAPKLLGGLIAIPLLTCLYDVVGIGGGYLVGVGLLGVNEGAYFQGMASSVAWVDVQMGLVKSVVFAVLVVWICAAKGYYLHLAGDRGFGAAGVSRATTSAVVLASVAILVGDYLISAVLL